MSTWVLHIEPKKKKDVEMLFLMESLGHNMLSVQKVAKKMKARGRVSISGPGFDEGSEA